MVAGQSPDESGFPHRGQAPAFSTGLYNLAKQIRKESLTCWILVGLAALASWPLGQMIGTFFGMMFSFVPFLLQPGLPTELDFPNIEAILLGGSTVFSLLGYIAGGFVSVGVVLAAYYIFKRTKNRTVYDLVYGNMALALIDEQYGFQIEESVKSKYRLVIGKVQHSGDFPGKVNHFAYYYKYYYRISFGPAELNVSSVSAESCWLEGCALAVCSSCPLVLVALVLRIIQVRPRVLAVKIAVLEYLEGKYDHLL